MKARITFTLDQDLLEKVKVLCDRDSRSLSNFISKVLEEEVERRKEVFEKRVKPGSKPKLINRAAGK